MMVKVIPHTPVHNSSHLWALCLVQFMIFLASRVCYFLYQGCMVIRHAWHESGILVVIPLVICMVFLSLYHLLLGMGIYKSLKNGGKIPALISKL